MFAGLTVVIDYGLSNIDSIVRILNELNTRVERTRDPGVIARADRLILPGVGSFGAAMSNLRSWRLDTAIHERLANSDVPFLGICLGMQLMASESHEHGNNVGLGIIEGSVVRLQASKVRERVPHIGWNEVLPNGRSLLFEEIRPGSDFYFAHSYHLKPVDSRFAIAVTPYCGDIVAAVALSDRQVYGTQFHPEKSQRNGEILLRNFLSL